MKALQRPLKLAFKHVIAAVLLTLSLAAQVMAGPLEDAIAARDRGDYATALRLIRPLAEQGDAIAQNNLGYMYSEGKGVPRDYTEEINWIRKAADQGYATARRNLGIMYYEGWGIPRDYLEAVKLAPPAPPPVARHCSSASRLLWRNQTSHDRTSSATAPRLPDTDQRSTHAGAGRP